MLNMNLQFLLIKRVGSTKNGRDSESKIGSKEELTDSL